MIRHLNKQLYEKNLGLLLIRVGTGLVFFMHGITKLQSIGMVNSFFTKSLGLPPGVAMLVAVIEVVGGAMLVLGVFTRVAAVVLGIEMLVAIFLTGGPAKGGWEQHELEALLMAVSFGLVYTGSGKFSLWHWDPKIDR
jgi:putative oxidoreductase